MTPTFFEVGFFLLGFLFIVSVSFMSFNILVFLIIIFGWFSGKIFQKARLPAVLGMTIWGITLSYFLKDAFPPLIWEIAPFLKSLALIVILLRAGMGIQKNVLEKVGPAAIKLAFIPCLFEGIAITFVSRYWLSFSWPEAGMLGFILAAVSPAVVVPSMLNLKEQGYGKKNEVPILVLAGASLDDIVAISVFTVFLNIYLGGESSYLKSIATVPYAIILGIAIGVCAGMFLSWFFKKYFTKIRATEKIILLLGFSFFLIQVGNWIHIAALLAVMTMGFILLEKNEVVAHELSLKLGKIWVFAEIILFVLIGMAVDVDVALGAGLIGIAVIACGIIFRLLGVFTALLGTRFRPQERIFCAIAYLPKATVQAALGAVPLLFGVNNGSVILSIAVLSICITAPLGLLGIKYAAPKLLDAPIK
jgi:solute carrier family 9B (sodium/hydrogen exchanger), member 1/2